MRGRDPTLDAPVVVHGQTTTLAPFQQAGLLCCHACHDCDPRWLPDALWGRLASRLRRDAGHHRRLAGGAGHVPCDRQVAILVSESLTRAN